MAAISKTPSGSYRGVFTSQPIDSVVDAVNGMQGNGTAFPGTFTNLTTNGTLTRIPTLIAAAGQTQGSATAIVGSKAVVTAYVTATHNGVRLPAAATGLEVEVVSGAGPGGFKVYPALHNFIMALASNVADTNLAAFKSNTYIAVNATTWAVNRGA